MNKFKKLLLTLAPLSAVAIATPIILTSCSTNATNTSGPSDPSKPDNGDGNGEINPNGDLTPDKTNENDFIPTTNEGLFKKVEETVKVGKKGDEEKQVETAFTAYSSPKEDDVKDAIKIWSFNKWFEATNINGVEKYISNFVDGFDGIKVVKKTTPTTKEETKSKWDISFSYKFQITVKINDKVENVLAEKSYSATNIELGSTIVFNTEEKMFMVNGKSMSNAAPSTIYNTKADEQESEVVQKVKQFLSEKTSTFDSKLVFKSFIKNKKIEGTQEQVVQKDGEWLDTIEKPNDAVTISEDKKTLTVDLSKIESTSKWYGLDKTLTETNVRSAVYTEDNKKVKNLTKTFKDLIFGNDKFTKVIANPSKISKGLKFDITYDDKANEKLILICNNVQGMN